MESKIHRLVLAALVLAGIAVIAPAAHGGVRPYGDANERVGAVRPDGVPRRAVDAQLDALSRASASSPTGSLPRQRTFRDSADRTNIGRGVVAATTPVSEDGIGFSWGDAGIGAGAALLLVGALGVALMAMRRGRGRVAVS